MTKNNFVKVATVVFAVAGVVHVYRAVNDYALIMNTWVVPVSLSWFLGLLGLVMAYSGYRYWNK